jgi:hypothetical protein
MKAVKDPDSPGGKSQMVNRAGRRWLPTEGALCTLGTHRTAHETTEEAVDSHPSGLSAEDP